MLSRGPTLAIVMCKYLVISKGPNSNCMYKQATLLSKGPLTAAAMCKYLTFKGAQSNCNV